MTWVTTHWQLKLLALVLSLGLFVAVAFAQNPLRTEQVAAPVVYRNPPSDKAMIGAPTRLPVTVYGLAADLAAMTPNSVYVDLDASKIVTGQQVTLQGRPIIKAAGVRSQFDTIPVTIPQVDTLVTVKVPIELRLQPATGWQINPDKTRVISPDKPLAISGPASLLTDLKAYIILPFAINSTADIPAVAINYERGGKPFTLPSNVTPAIIVAGDWTTAVVHVEATKVTQKRTVPLVETPTGTPAPGYRITAVQISPLFIDILGSVDDLSSIDSITLAPINVDGASANVVKSLKVSATTVLGIPANANITFAIASVTVTVVIQQNPVVHPSPAPSPSP